MSREGVQLQVGGDGGSRGEASACCKHAISETKDIGKFV